MGVTLCCATRATPTFLGILTLAGLAGCDAPASLVDAGASDAGTRSDAATEDAAMGRDAAGDDGGGAPLDAGRDASVMADGGTSRLDDVLAVLTSASASASEIDALVYDVAWRGGWPLVEGERYLFVTRWDGAPSGVAVVGHINDWSPTASPATRAASGVHYWALLDAADFVAPAVGSKYKWYGATDVYRAPPEATAYGFDEFGEHGWVRPPTSEPWLERFPAFASAHLSDRRAFRAYLPAGFVPRSAAAARARTLLLHDGQNVFHPDAFFGGWAVDEALAASAAHADVVALAIDNAPDRMSAYTHVVDTISGGRTGGRADDYIALVRDEALPFFRERYGVEARGDALAAAGSSLGGLVSLVMAMREPDLAGCYAALSPTLGWGSFAAGQRDALANLWPAGAAGHLSASLYLDSGGGGACRDSDGDGVEDDGTGSDNYCVTRQMRDLLASRGYALDVDLFYTHTPDAPHNEAAWRARMPGVLAACASGGWARR